MYPEPDRFIKAYADYIGCDMANVFATNGSDYGIRVLLETFGEPGKEVVTVSPSFEIYWVCCSLLGLKHVPIEYEKNLTLDATKVLSAIGADTRIVVLLNPNSPIGTVFTQQEVEQIINRAKEVDALVVIDEAYHYFYKDSYLPYALAYDNVVCLRTFSKLMSMAGLRLGVMVGHADIIRHVKQSRLTYEVNSIALLFGEKILQRPDIIHRLTEIEIEGKQYLIDELRKRDYWYMDGLGNYVLLKPKHNPKEVAARLETEHRVLVHTYSNETLHEMFRVTVGSKTVMQRFLEALEVADT